ncbi:hypothetical protein BCR44DRAFT_1015972 [Catenaria anguillulae PL171]|uniref:SH3 domain-containing protein n=1 Tax=Catenaria anguillulae PL171 TaxID=765915 RepID=A0A1Y2HVS6_9FUNG|nr:hypothetical protein BCR44DRAFT_1015972 [Catenaria anguillulae PL171]
MMVVQQHQEATLGRDGEFGNGTMTEDDFMAEFEGEQYKASRNYDPGMSDEMELVVGDMISVTSKYDDGWAYGLNLSTGQLGVFPLNFAEPVGDERENPVAVPTRQSMYGNSDRLSQYRKSVKLDVMIDDAPLDVDFSKGPGSNVGAKQQQQQPQQQQQQEADPRQTAVPADPSSISALMAVLEKISADERGGEIAPELKDKKKRETIEFKVAKLPPDVRDSIVSSATNDHHNSRFSFSALMSVLDDPQLQHHQSVYLDKKAGSRDTLYRPILL